MSEPATIEQTGFKWGDDEQIPEWMRGTTGRETIETINTLVDGARQIVQENQQLQQQYAQAQQLPSIQATPQMTNPNEIDPNLILDNPQEYQRQLREAMRQESAEAIAQAAQPLLQQNSALARSSSQTDPTMRDIWARYGREIDQQVANVPLAMRTKEVYDQAARLVRGAHYEELATEKAQAIAAEMGTTASSTPSTSYRIQGQEVTDTDDAWSKIESNPFGKHMMQTLGKGKIVDHCDRQGLTLEEFAEEVSGTKATIDPMHPGRWTNPDMAPWEKKDG